MKRTHEKLNQSIIKSEFFFFLNDPAPTEFSPLPLHAALPISYIADSPVEGNPEGNRAFEVSQTIAHRGTEAWASRTIAIGTERAEGRRGEGDYWFFSPDLSRSEEHTSELQSRLHLVCRLLLEK